MIIRRLRTCLMASLWSMGCSAAIADDPQYADQLPRIAPTAAADSIEKLRVADGFRVDLVASEPLVNSPVAIEWDASGAMFVCEMRGYSEDRDDGVSRITRLRDTDGDGVYDARTIFADGLAWPTGLFPYDGGLFIGDAPDLWYMKDTDGDGVADQKQRVLTGFGTSNVQGLMNSFRWGLDNRIHIACSSTGGDIRPAYSDPNSSTVSIRGRDLALNPRTFQFEPTSGAAQHGMSFDDWGRKFVSSNSDHLQQVLYDEQDIAGNPYVITPPARISIAADGPQAEVYRDSPVEPWRILRTQLRVSGKASGPIEGGGRAAGYFTGATGVTIYRGDAWPNQWKGLAVVGDVGGNLIHRKRLHPDGIRFIGKRIDQESEFVTSSDIWFRPAQFANAPDGTLHVIDVYREVIEHPKSLPPEIKKHLDLTAGRDRGRIYRISAIDSDPKQVTWLQNQPTDVLVQNLASPNAWHRETAARLIYQRRDLDATAAIRALAETCPDPLGRMHAMYALDGLDSLSEADLLIALGDDHPQVRRHAVRLARSVIADPSKVSSPITDALFALSDDESIEVRYQLAFTMSEFSGPRKVDTLASMIQHDLDSPDIRFAVAIAIGADADALRTKLQNSDRFEGPNAQVFLKSLKEQIDARSRSPHATTDQNAPTADRSTDAGPATAQTEQQKEKRTEWIRKYRPVLQMAADTNRGKELFKQHCSACHIVEGVGNAVGPNLVAVQTRGAETLLTGILAPNREVNPQYLGFVVLTNQGQVFSGMLVDENRNSVTLRGSDGKAQTVLKIDIDQMRSTGLSIMPEGFEEKLDGQAMADLIQYLMNAS
ncbi:Cytochrome c [Rubripirellula lacrimiformis]|uniref:Cytochrome c n=1 Tax=Rubripirellula lacrimiformis TaxID=1930273 RepID=A0A517NAF7_9BACT|nr:PVC-type heme-binding CxxCH protein [Rubripirellula lacrimiformis]QDT04112.1 Cytochrome c [Rubripirellula lacrimiformis]